MHVAVTFMSIALTTYVFPVACWHQAERFIVDLEMPPEKRWDHIFHHYDIDQFRNMAMEVIESFLPKTMIPALNILVSPIGHFLPEPYASEIKGIAKISGLGLGEVIGLNIVYDATAYCTSIVAEDTEGVIWHGRNMDHDTFVEEMRNMTIVVDYYRHGMVEYTTTSFLGQVGSFTGMRPHAFSINLNERDWGSLRSHIKDILQAILLKRGVLTSFVLRDVIATKRNYREAVFALSTTQLVAPVYIMVSGIRPGEGMVITRDQQRADIWHLDAENGRWWLLQTNYDHWTTPPDYDIRHGAGDEAMSKVGIDHINDRTMFEVFATEPVLREGTVYSTLMCAAKPEIYLALVKD